MRSVQWTIILITIGLLGCTSVNEQRFRYLEEVEGSAALDWVRKQNQSTLEVLKDARYPQFLASADKIVNATDRIATVSIGAVLSTILAVKVMCGCHPTHKFDRFTDVPDSGAANVLKTILDIDELARRGRELGLQGSVCLEPGYARCLLRLSRGGTDASIYREFDMVAKQFVDDGFVILKRNRGLRRLMRTLSWWD